MKIHRPILLLGPGHSGTTLIYRILSTHPELGYFTNWTNRFPKHIWLAALARFRMPSYFELTGKHFKGYPAPAEAYRIWRHCFPRFWEINHTYCQDSQGQIRLQDTISKHLKYQGKSRFISKVTGSPILSFFQSIFPDAYFVWIDRDPRAVVYSTFTRMKSGRIPLSMLRVPQPENIHESHRWVSVSRNIFTEDEHFFYLAHSYLSTYRAIKRESIPYYRIMYEDFVANPVEMMIQLVDYLGLARDESLLNLVEHWAIRKDANQRWRKALAPHQRSLLEDILAEPLADIQMRHAEPVRND